ncbi:hypothetical protein CA51_07230 [Rosistilla oblonga]|uniref:Uncharacterized protein n=1 Tax=Rosistilla oblonga TaxID=2527990 RepID=A0A518IQB4_9BACT|nr:hypothetical protein CA51_07230 [Rosistilla oblonga]QDV55284.1 hypothetical protein Mal33_12540 [Rosistilla oblonga]
MFGIGVLEIIIIAAVGLAGIAIPFCIVYAAVRLGNRDSKKRE